MDKIFWTNIGIILLILLIPGEEKGWTSEAGQGIFKLLPEMQASQTGVFDADPFMPRLGISKQLTSNKIIGHIGQEIDLLGLRLGKKDSTNIRLPVTVGLAGYSITLLSRNGNKFPLLAVDYLFGGYIRIPVNQFTLRFALTHISAHLGDRYMFEEDSPIKPRIYSREYISLLLIKNHKNLRLYGGWHYIYHSIPEVEQKSFQAGFSWSAPFSGWGFRPYISLDHRWRYNFRGRNNFSLQTGLKLEGDGGRAYRLSLNYYDGGNIFGQFFRRTSRLVGVSLLFDY
ncbi:MAG: hypothetical protein Kow0037_28260 [Calditrichia bacterium]